MMSDPELRHLLSQVMELTSLVDQQQAEIRRLKTLLETCRMQFAVMEARNMGGGCNVD
jgi:hypothetical protein